MRSNSSRWLIVGLILVGSCGILTAEVWRSRGPGHSARANVETSPEPVPLRSAATDKQTSCGAEPPAAGDKPALSDAECKSFQTAAEYSRDGKGTAVLVLRAGEIIFEDYANDTTATTPHLLASGTKSFSGIMAQCAVEDGLFQLDDKVSETITEWKTDPRKKEITIRQLLTLTSGLGGGSIGQVPTYAEAIAGNAVADPGSSFIYGPIPFQSFGELMRRKLSPRSETVEGYLKRKILDPIGMKVAMWRKGQDGNPMLPQGLSLTPREWAKFGEMIRLKGKVGDKQIITPEHLAECFQGTTANPGYGLTFWLNKKGAKGPAGRLGQRGGDGLQPKPLNGEAGPVDLVLAAGALGQRCYVIPSLDMVIIRQGFSRRIDFDDREFLTRLLNSSKQARPE